MSKRTKGWLMAATAMLLIGSMLFVGVMTVLKWNFRKLSADEYETNTHTVTENISHVSVNVKTADVVLAPSVDNTISVVCYERADIKHAVAVEGDTLVVQASEELKWYRDLGIHIDKAKITVYLPAGAYGELKIHATTGDVTIPKDFPFASADVKVTTGDVAFSADVADDLAVKVTTGDMKLSAVTCRNLMATATTGDVALRQVIATEAFTIKCTTGNVVLDACDAASLSVKTTTGNITGTLLTTKVFDAHATTGRVKVPQTTEGGQCKLRATTGHIKISVK